MLFQGLFYISFSIRKNCWCEELHASSHRCCCCEQLVSAKKADTYKEAKTCAHIDTSTHTDTPWQQHCVRAQHSPISITAFPAQGLSLPFNSQPHSTTFQLSAAQCMDMTNTWLTLERRPESRCTARCTVHIHSEVSCKIAVSFCTGLDPSQDQRTNTLWRRTPLQSLKSLQPPPSCFLLAGVRIYEWEGGAGDDLLLELTWHMSITRQPCPTAF